MDLFLFASRSEENIWRGVRAKLWAVAMTSERDMKSRITKSQKYLNVDSHGLLYCVPTRSFTTPFIVQSRTDIHKVVRDVWTTPWVLPFSIEPLGNPSMQLSINSAKTLWPLLHRRAHYPNVAAAMNITGTTVFVPIDITDEEWNVILEHLAVDHPVT